MTNKWCSFASRQTWGKIIDFETRLPKYVEQLIKAQ